MVAVDAEEQDRLQARVELQHRGRVGIGGQLVDDRADAPLDVDGGRVDVRRVQEGDRDLRAALRRRRLEDVDVGDAGDGVLERLGDQPVNVVWRRARVGRDDRDHGKLMLGNSSAFSRVNETRPRMTIAEITIRMKTGRVMATRVRPISAHTLQYGLVLRQRMAKAKGPGRPETRPRRVIASIATNSSSISNYYHWLYRRRVPMLSPFCEPRRSDLARPVSSGRRYGISIILNYSRERDSFH